MAIFAHRGLVSKKNNIPENSLASLKNALDAGFVAIEFDIWFVNQQLIISHDEPKNGHLTLFNFLEYSLLHSKQPLLYWLDFKNVNSSNAAQIALQTKHILEKLNISLENCYFAPFITNYQLVQKIYLIWQNIFHNFSFIAVLEEEKQFLKCQQFIIKHQINYLSINHHLLTNHFIMNSLKNHCPNIKLFAWTIKNLETYFNLKQHRIENFASDIVLTNL
jgi:glycerophosphoryl diester phosphodiesterase